MPSCVAIVHDDGVQNCCMFLPTSIPQGLRNSPENLSCWLMAESCGVILMQSLGGWAWDWGGKLDMAYHVVG